MILAGLDDFDYPHIDWVCETCGSVFVSSGPPDTDHCLEGHHATWRPNDDQLAAYTDLLESLSPSDGIVICGDGPAALMGPVETTDENQLTTLSIDAPSRTVEWNREKPAIEWRRTDDEYATGRDVYHVETVNIESTTPLVEGSA